MVKNFLRFMYSHFCENKPLYFLAVGSVVLGCVLGVCGGKGFSDDAYLSSFFGGISELSTSALLVRAVLSALILSAAAFVFGLSPVGFLAMPVVAAYRGFAFGFAAAAFHSVYGLKAVVFILIALFGPAVLWLPPLIVTAVMSSKTSISVMRICRRRSAPTFSSEVRLLGASSAAMFLFMLMSRLAEIYIIPPILNVVCGLYI